MKHLTPDKFEKLSITALDFSNNSSNGCRKQTKNFYAKLIELVIKIRGM